MGRLGLAARLYIRIRLLPNHRCLTQRGPGEGDGGVRGKKKRVAVPLAAWAQASLPAVQLQVAAPESVHHPFGLPRVAPQAMSLAVT